MKLGKKEPINKKALNFADYLVSIPEHPIVDTAPNYTFPMDLNDQYGCCVVAAFDHSRQVITGLITGSQKNFTEQEIIDFYKSQNPQFPQEDNGMSVQLFLEYLTEKGYIKGFASIDYRNTELMKAASYLGLSLMTGVMLQEAQRQQFPNEWSYILGSPVIGGHAINMIGYDSTTGQFVSWGKSIPVTFDFVDKQMDEAWFILTQEHIDHPEFRNHFDLTSFSKAVSAITDGKIQIPLPTTPPPAPQPVTPVSPVIPVPTPTPAPKLSWLQTLINWIVSLFTRPVTPPIVNPVPNRPYIETSTINLIKQFEGCVLHSYQDAGGWAIGYGFNSINGIPVTSNTPPITQQEADTLLENQILPQYANAVNTVKPTLTQSQFDSLCSLAYNIGIGAFLNSTVYRDINLGDFQGAAQAFLLWDKSGGVVNPALVARRQKEMQLFLS